MQKKISVVLLAITILTGMVFATTVIPFFDVLRTFAASITITAVIGVLTSRKIVILKRIKGGSLIFILIALTAVSVYLYSFDGVYFTDVLYLDTICRIITLTAISVVIISAAGIIHIIGKRYFGFLGPPKGLARLFSRALIFAGDHGEDSDAYTYGKTTDIDTGYSFHTGMKW
jgi:hypothetical protein